MPDGFVKHTSGKVIKGKERQIVINRFHYIKCKNLK
jgi:hypothetical protein